MVAVVAAGSGCHSNPDLKGESCPAGVMSFEGEAGFGEAWHKGDLPGLDSV